MSKKQTKISIKIQRLLENQLNSREYLHHFGPKKFKFLDHATALLLKETLKCSFRRISKILELLGIKTPTYSALCKSRKRIPVGIWRKLLELTAGLSSGIVAIDGTGFSQTNPSFHYVKRIDSKKPVKRFAKLSAFFDLVTKKFLKLKVRKKPRHDIKDAVPLVKQTSGIRKLYGDSGYDAEKLYETCLEKKIQTVIKPKKNVKKGWARRKQMEKYSEEDYHKRSLIESGFGSLKRKYGGNVLARSSKGMKVEIYLKAISHNMNLVG
jgi:transposase